MEWHIARYLQDTKSVPFIGIELLSQLETEVLGGVAGLFRQGPCTSQQMKEQFHALFMTHAKANAYMRITCHGRYHDANVK